MHQHFRPHDTAIEAPLNGDRLATRHHGSAVAFRTGIDQRAAARILDHKLLPEHVGHLALDRDRSLIGHLVDRCRLQ
jgi:hypothetical protein